MASKASYVERGYGQVEPNHLSAQRTAQIYAQLPAAADIEILENGQFVKYNYADGVVDFEGEGEWMLVYNEVKIYKDDETDADFAMKKADFSDLGTMKRNVNIYDAAGNPMKTGTNMVPRVFKTNVGDIFTTNMIKVASPEVGTTILAPGTDGVLDTAGDDATMKWQVVKVYTLADGQKAVKIMRIA